MRPSYTPPGAAGTLLGLHALTALHPGTGAALGTVDLPVQRERHTHWPTVAGSALKGVLRDACRARIAARADLDTLARWDDKPREPAKRAGSSRDRADATLLLNELFGPPTAGSAEFAGALSITDARLVAYPVRSLRGVFAWVSCPEALDRLQRDAALADLEAAWDVPRPGADQLVAPEGCPCVVDGRVVLEEFDFTCAAGSSAAVAAWLADQLLPVGPVHARTRQRLRQHLLVLSNDDFTHFVRHATEVTARVGLNYETKTVKGGALFYQEFLPAETLFYAVVLASPARVRQGAAHAPATLLDRLRELVPAVIQVGGDETTGKGYCTTWLGAPAGGGVGGKAP